MNYCNQRVFLFFFLVMMLTGCAAPLHQQQDLSAQGPPPLDPALICNEILPPDLTGQSARVDNFILIFDASASMTESYREILKFDLAQKLSSCLNHTIPAINIKAGIRTFAHPVYSSLVYGITDYEKQEFERHLLEIKNGDGLSPLTFALKKTKRDVATLPGKTAIIIVSDGRSMDISPVLEAGRLKEKFQDRICIYPILIGDDEKGESIMTQIDDVDQCGFMEKGDDLIGGQAMSDYVRRIFLSPAAAAPEIETAMADDDGDGVENRTDRCPDTPRGAMVDKQGCWNGEVMANVLFDFDHSNIKAEGKPILNRVFQLLHENPALHLEIHGHTDIIGTKDYNQGLSKRRAEAGKNFLVNRGITSERITTHGHGYAMPVANNKTPEGRSKNRRIEFRFIDTTTQNNRQ